MKLRSGETLTLVTSTGADIDVHASWNAEGNHKQALPGSDNTKITTATTTTIVDNLLTFSSVKGITDLVIRNIDSTSNVVTLKHTDVNGTVVEVYKTTLAAGAQIQYDTNQGWTAATLTPAGSQLITLAADVINADANANTLADITGMTFAVVAGNTYRFMANIPYTAAATTTGSRWTVNGPAMTSITYRSSYPLDTTTATTNYSSALQSPAAANASSNLLGNLASITGVFKPSADGTFALQFASEVTVSAITAKAGATLEWQLLLTA